MHKMKLFQAYHILVLFSLTATTIAVGVPSYAKSGCSDMCGKVRIPYPFGIGASCSLNRWFIVDCNSPTPYLSALSDLQVLRVNLENQTITVDMTYYECLNPVGNSSQIMSINLASSPFLFSKSHNKFVFKGCGNAVMTDHGSHVLSECSTNCQNDTLSDCQMTVPHYLKSYGINVTRQGGDERACGSAFLVEENSYVEGRFSGDTNNSYVPTSLLWTLSDGDMYNYTMDVLDEKVNCYFQQAIVEVDLSDHISMKSWKCVTYDAEGNPYLPYGHYDAPYDSEECARCTHRGKYCRFDKIYDPDGVFMRWNFTCVDSSWFENKANKTSLGVILGVSISMGVIFLVIISYLLYKFIKKTKAKRQRKRFFKRNGGLLLKQQEETDSSLVGKTILFTSRELEKATDNFNENRILGRGGQGTVYKGMLVDGRIVAIKKSKIVDESQLEQFINEVVILSQVNHRNVVRLLGCCLETNVPLLVSEFIQNGTLYDRLHNQIDEFPFSLNMRLQIATEVARALAYLHSATSIPIYHRDIKSTNILLDDKYKAKVSDFGTSRFVSIDQTHLTTLVKGTFGYLDPEYFQSSQFTEKSDVYSFGVVLVELLTGERPISLTRFGENRSLATHFMLAMEDGRAMSIFDATVIKEGTRNELLEIANLAMRCLNLNGKYRPTMKEVATELETMRTSHIPSTGQGTNGPMMYADDLTVLAYGESSSTFLSFNTNISL